jgi:hypothetical protein
MARPSYDSTIERRRREYASPPHYYNIRTICEFTMFHILKDYGRDQPSPRELDEVRDSWRPTGHTQYSFTLTFAQKQLAANDFELCDRVYVDQEKYHPLVDLGLLEPLLWEEFQGDFLILYHPAEKSFWAWCGPAHEMNDRDRLIRLGYKWTDIFLKDPVIHFYRLYRPAERIIVAGFSPPKGPRGFNRGAPFDFK